MKIRARIMEFSGPSDARDIDGASMRHGSWTYNDKWTQYLTLPLPLDNLQISYSRWLARLPGGVIVAGEYCIGDPTRPFRYLHAVTGGVEIESVKPRKGPRTYWLVLEGEIGEPVDIGNVDTEHSDESTLSDLNARGRKPKGTG